MKKGKVKAATSDKEAEAQFRSVSNYHLEDGDRSPVSFAVLPIQWGEAENSDATKGQVFLHGFVDNVRQIMLRVIAWRFDLSNAKPEISLLSSKDKTWIKLQKPRNSFQDTIRTILVSVHFLHRVKRNPNMSDKSVWDNLCKDKELSSCKLKPSQKDLSDHMSLIGEAAKRDAVLAKSEILLAVLKILLEAFKEKLGNKKLSDEEVKDLIRPTVVVGDIDNSMVNEAQEESKAESGLSVCAICDDGGDVLSCEGPCMRSFHVTKEDGGDSCDSLGFTQKDIEAMKGLYCKNCEYNQHQCFACGKLGSSGNVKAAEVIKCAYATCEHFYHPHCVAKLTSQVVEPVAEEQEINTADAKKFTCPVHYCCVCKEVENTKIPELQFAVCRRCPKSYHRKCLPREIAFDDSEDDIVTRAWNGLLPNSRILIYCLNHEVDEELGTPLRDHIKFPDIKAAVRNINASNERMKPATKQKVKSNKNNVDLHNSSGKSPAKGSKVTGKLASGKVGSKEHSEKGISGSTIDGGKRSSSPHVNVGQESQDRKKQKMSNSGKTPLKRKHTEEKQGVVSSAKKQAVDEKLAGVPVLCQPDTVEGNQPKSVMASPHVEVGVNGDQHSEPIKESGTPCNGKGQSVANPNTEEQHSREKGKQPEDTATFSPKPEMNLVCPKCSKKHDGECRKNTCYDCGQAGHFTRNCTANDQQLEPLKESGTPSNGIENPQNTSSFSPKPEVKQDCPKCGKKHGGECLAGKNECVKCGQPGHIAKTCTAMEAPPLKPQQSDNREQVGLNGVQIPDSRQSAHLSGHVGSCGDMGDGHAQRSPKAESSNKKTNTPAVEEHATCRDELNHTRMVSLGSAHPAAACGNGTSGRVHRPLGFVAGPNLAYSLNHSAGWLDE